MLTWLFLRFHHQLTHTLSLSLSLTQMWVYAKRNVQSFSSKSRSSFLFVSTLGSWNNSEQFKRLKFQEKQKRQKSNMRNEQKEENKKKVYCQRVRHSRVGINVPFTFKFWVDYFVKIDCFEQVARSVRLLNIHLWMCVKCSQRNLLGIGHICHEY